MRGGYWWSHKLIATTVFALLAPVPLPGQSGDSMKKRNDPDELRTEYSLEDFPAGLERGKYAVRMAEGSNIVRLDPRYCPFLPG